MKEIRRARIARKVGVAGTVGCTVAALIIVVAVDTPDGDNGSFSFRPDANPGGAGTHLASAHVRFDGDLHSPADGNPYQETVPCTGPKDPVNFEVYSAGPSADGLPFTGNSRRCDVGAPPEGWPNNYVSYFYGKCKIPKDATGCALPLEIQTWPACQRSKAEYTFNGKPLPYRVLPSRDGAEVVEFTFPADRIEVYTKSATIVIFSTDSELARKAVRQLRLQEEGKPPATKAEELRGSVLGDLAPPSDGSTEGVLRCQS